MIGAWYALYIQQMFCNRRTTHPGHYFYPQAGVQAYCPGIN